MCSIILTVMLVIIVVAILVSVVALGGLVTTIVFSDLFVGAAAIIGALYLIRKYKKK